MVDLPDLNNSALYIFLSKHNNTNYLVHIYKDQFVIWMLGIGIIVLILILVRDLWDTCCNCLQIVISIKFFL